MGWPIQQPHLTHACPPQQSSAARLSLTIGEGGQLQKTEFSSSPYNFTIDNTPFNFFSFRLSPWSLTLRNEEWASQRGFEPALRPLPENSPLFHLLCGVCLTISPCEPSKPPLHPAVANSPRALQLQESTWLRETHLYIFVKCLDCQAEATTALPSPLPHQF